MGEKRYPEGYSDGDIVEMFGSDREKAFRMLMGKYSRRLYLYIRRMLISHDDTDDVLQNTLVKAWENIGSLKQSVALSSWLYRIATNETMSFLSEKARRAHVSLDEVELADETSGEDLSGQAERMGALTLKAIHSLPKAQQTVFTMKHFEGLKYREISEVLGTSEGALKASYHIALEKIRIYLRENADQA